jgi:hypothetical protein
MLHTDAISRNIGVVCCEENITEARIREAQQNDTFCNSLTGNNEFYRNDSDLLYKIKENTK